MAPRKQPHDYVPGTVAAKLVALMDAKGFNALSLAKAARANTTAVQDILSGKVTRPRADTLAKLAEPLGVTALDLMPGDPPPVAAEISPREQAMLDLFRNLPPGEQDRFMKVAAALAKPADDDAGDGTHG